MNNPGAVGLASLQQHGVAIPSETKNIEYFFNLAKKMSDGQLADILSGKNLDVPQFVAMTEAMGRKQLRQAADGAQAQQMAKQPSVKDRLLAEEAARTAPMQMAGIDQLPADNMKTLAGGGIIAFDNGGDVYDRWKSLASDEGEGVNKLLDPIYGFFTNRYGQEAKARRLEREKQTALKDVANTTFYDDTIDPNLKQKAPVTAPAANTAAPAASPTAPKSNAPAAPGSQVDITQPTTQERRANPFAQMRADAIDETGIKDRGLGFGLMKLASHVISTPGTKGFGEGINALADQGLLTQKELKDAKKDARDYNFNIAKASEAAEQGNDELALKYKTLAEQTDYHKTMGKAAMITAGAHATTAAAAGDKPQLAIYKDTMDNLQKELKSNIAFKQKWNNFTPEQQAQYARAMYENNLSMYNSLTSGKSNSSALFDPAALDAELKKRGLG